MTDRISTYINVLSRIERAHRRLLDVIKDGLDRAGEKDVNAVQALLLFNIGTSELTAGELRSKGCYLGSNVSYNLKKLVEGGYVNHDRSDSDRRSVLVSLTDDGMRIRDIVANLYASHAEKIGLFDLEDEALVDLEKRLALLERFLEDQVRFQL